MKDYRIDSHKLIYHPKAVSTWLDAGDVFPINVEFGISGACNHRCIFCGVDYLGYKPEMLSADLLLPNLKDMYQRGLKSVTLAGNGEPLVNKDAVEIINGTRAIGLDVAMSTNGVLFTKEIADECMGSLTWMRFSTSAYSDENYQRIQGAKPGDIDKVFTNIAYASELKRKKNLKTTIGVQLVLIPENMEEAYQLGLKARELGADYFTIKSFGYQPQSNSKLKQEFDRDEFYAKQEELEQQIASLTTENFTGIYRRARIDQAKEKRPYQECHALPFYSLIDSAGNVWPCCILMGNEGMCFGNLYEKSFLDIWYGEERKQVLQRIKERGFAQCSLDCRLDAMNRYLQELKYPNTHVNFI
jgi:radical SAM protein with 4Fe4S-binding SPASM domain